ncbi:unnamed protein product [Fraxinus pennsylvanica]|uniref:Glucosidase 2 subunit beta n=1 Tax=Fraxinus pennsylvanica TaxID=56036 RepID=A0AAD2DZ41_9LAMI|nr:unnamed protein product [Fraxinus pennsylvanica]
MKLRLGRVVLLFCAVLMYGISRSASVPSKATLLGVAPEDEKHYNGLSSSGTIKCKDGSKKFSKSQFNDDFCDCPDGSDEPGTSACPDGKFYCKNAGHVPLFLYSSRVNDGLCDCCDGSDEYDGKIKCPNTCWEAGKVARDKLEKKITTFKEGVIIRRRETEEAKLAIAREEAELTKLKDEEKILKGLVQQLKEHKELIDKSEEKELLQKEKEELERKEHEEAKLKESKAEENTESIGEPEKNDIYDKDALEDNHKSVGDPEISDQTNRAEQLKEDSLQDTEQKEGDSTVDGKAGLDTGNQEKHVLEDTESLSREELGRRVASRWTGEMTEQQSKEGDTSKDNDPQNHEETLEDRHDEEYNGYDSEDVEQRDDDDDDDDDSEDQMEEYGEDDHDDSGSSYKPDSDDESHLSDITSINSQTWLEKIRQTVRSIFQAVKNFRTPVDISDAARVRKEYDESSSKLSKIQSRISSLTQKLKYDFGMEKEFYPFHGQCFESKQNKYVYKICPFKQATQMEGHSTTRLGSWEKFEESYGIMLFSNGDHCWNGPNRSLKVKMRCGLKNEVTDIGEPSRCEYVALLSTPAMCVEDKLKELEVKLETMNKKQPQGHDEL